MCVSRSAELRRHHENKCILHPDHNDCKQVLVTKDDHGTTASFALDEGGLQQTDAWDWATFVSTRAMLKSTADNYVYVSDS